MQQIRDDQYNVLNQITRQLERIEDRTRDMVTRADLDALRKELVGKESLEPQLAALKAQITRVDADRMEDKKDVNARVDDIERDQIGRQDRLWLKLGPIAGILAFIITLLQFLMHIKVTP